MNQPIGDIKNSYYLQRWWRKMPPPKKRRWYIGLSLFALFWVAGAFYAPTVVAGIGRLSGGARLLMSLGMGGFAWLWGGLKAMGAMEETAQEPNLLWLPLSLALPAAMYGFFYLLDQVPNPLVNMQRQNEEFARTQGRVQEEEISQALPIKQGIPLAELPTPTGTLKVGLDYQQAEGHVLVVGPTRSGKGLHLTDTLLTYPGAALVIDPKGEQFARTAAFRSQFGPVYHIPGHQVDLAQYYHHLLDRDDTAELHYHLLRPWESRETIFADKALALFTAVGLYAQEKHLNPIRVLLDLAESDPEEALTGLEAVTAVKRHVRVFTNGAKPETYREDKFVTSAFGNFTTRLAGYQKHLATIAPPDPTNSRLVVYPEWVSQNGTVYITYNLQDLQGVGGVVAAIIAAMLRYQLQKTSPQKLLVAVDELPTIGLHNVANYLATCGGYGITLLLYVQSISQLTTLYKPEGARSILSNCVHQVWYAPAEYETAETMSQLYGMTLKVNPSHTSSRGARSQPDKEGKPTTQTNTNRSASWSWQEKAALLPSQMMSLSKEQVLVTTLKRQRFVFLGQRLNPIPLLNHLPTADSLRLPRPHNLERQYTPWETATHHQPPPRLTGREAV